MKTWKFPGETLGGRHGTLKSTLATLALAAGTLKRGADAEGRMTELPEGWTTVLVLLPHQIPKEVLQVGIAHAGGETFGHEGDG